MELGQLECMIYMKVYMWLSNYKNISLTNNE